VSGRVLHFYLAGINNQNFLMRDKETGTWWQQITGKAIYGPLRGATLDLVPSDELTFGEWKSEVSEGKVLDEVPKYIKQYDSNWEPEIAKLPLVITFPGTELKSRDVVVGLQIDGPGRAYPWETMLKQSPIMDHVKGMPILVAVGPDKKSFRVFVARVNGNEAEFFLKNSPAADPSESKSADSPLQPNGKASNAPEPRKTRSDGKPCALTQPASPWILVDTATGSEWNFQGCAISGPAQGTCLEHIPALKDFWFDWRNYHPQTTLYTR
jgi:hypothetical protein